MPKERPRCESACQNHPAEPSRLPFPDRDYRFQVEKMLLAAQATGVAGDSPVVSDDAMTPDEHVRYGLRCGGKARRLSLPFHVWVHLVDAARGRNVRPV